MKKPQWLVFVVINILGIIGFFALFLKLTNAILILSVLLIIFDILFIFITNKLHKINKDTKIELENTRNELTKTIEEMAIHSSELEEKTKKMKVMEQDLLDAQEELNEIVSELSIHSQQLEEILNNIDVGVCTITPDLKIEANFNNQFRKIFGSREYWEQSILDTIFSSFDAKTKHEIQEFVELVFTNTSVSSDMLNEANPVKEFSYIRNENGTIETKEILTTVVPIKNDENVIKLMFLFKDVSYPHIVIFLYKSSYSDK